VSIVVANDLPCSSGNGLNVGHASITINLNGHTLSGFGGGSYGVNNPGFSAVTIENGTVSGWAEGVVTSGSTNKLSGLRASQNTDTGLVLLGSGSTALGNVLFKNGGFGIRVIASNIKVVSNTVRENGAGIIVQFGFTGAVFQTNQVENNGGNGIQDDAAGTAMTGNVTNANANDGVFSAGDQTATVASNTANYNGIEASPGGKDGGGNTAKGNVTAAQCKDVVCS
jgi:parallel beta-helix repeat protein